jgi:hypothetical protein
VLHPRIHVPHILSNTYRTLATWVKTTTPKVRCQVKKTFFSVSEKLAILLGHTIRALRKPEVLGSLFAGIGLLFVYIGISGAISVDVGRIVLGIAMLFAAWRQSQ